METPGSRPFGAKLYSEVLSEGITYIDRRRSGVIKSLQTPWPTFNSAGVGGIEWNSLITIGARPGAGKTMFVSQILKEARMLNPTQAFNILEFQFEMGEKQAASRAFAAEMALDYNEILSTNKQLDEFTFKRIKQFKEETLELERQDVRRMVINTPLTHANIEKAINYYFRNMSKEIKPMIITIDHSWLIKKDVMEREKLNTLYNTVEMLMTVKNSLPIIVLMITQLNRSIDEPSRKTPGSIANYPTSSDVFGGDALQQGSDMVVVLNRPFKADIPIYGPKEYECKSDDVFLHILKSRNGSEDTNLAFLKADFKKQRMDESVAPKSGNPMGRFVPRRAGGTGRQRPIESADIDV